MTIHVFHEYLKRNALRLGASEASSAQETSSGDTAQAVNPRHVKAFYFCLVSSIHFSGDEIVL
jgi:hypothetical protein